MGILSLLVLMPIVGGLALLFVRGNNKLPQYAGIAIGLATLILTVVRLVRELTPTSGKLQFEEKFEWIPALGISYHLGADGIATMLIGLTALLSVVALAFSYYVDKKPNLFVSMILILEGSMIGAFSSLDLILFFTFFEATLVPMWLLVNVWGGERRAFAANKFLVYTFAGSIFLLLGMVVLAIQHRQVSGELSFDLVQIQALVAEGKFWAGATGLEGLIFWSFVVAFLIKAPSFPFHTWIPDTYAESPIVGPILSSVMVKLGTFGILRFVFPLFPDVLAQNVPILSGLAVVSIVYGAILAAVQKDVRRLLAYSSLSHMGFVLLGLFSLTPNGMIGGAYQQLTHGITASMLFLLVGFLFQRRGTTEMAAFGGLKAQMPVFAALFLVAMLGSVGLPGTNGFVGEFLALLGSFEAGFNGVAGLNVGYAVAAGLGTVLGAVYLLYMFQQVFYGPVHHAVNRRLRDLKPWEIGLATVLALFVLWGGMAPSVFTDPMTASLESTRLMATSPEGQRPTFTTESVHEVPSAGVSTAQ